MNLTAEELEALHDGEPVVLTVEGEECVLVPRTAYDRVKDLLSAQHEFEPSQAYPLVNAVLSEDDDADPLLDTYEVYRP